MAVSAPIGFFVSRFAIPKTEHGTTVPDHEHAGTRRIGPVPRREQCGHFGGPI